MWEILKKQQFILHIISSLKHGGAEHLLADMIQELAQYNHQVIYMHDGPVRKRLERQGIFCFKLKGLIHSCDPVAWIKLYSLIKRVNPDVLHTSLWAANFLGRILGRLLGIPTVSVIHAEAKHQGRMRTVLDAITFRYSDQVVAVSQGVKKSFECYYWAAARPIQVIQNGLDVQRLRTEYIHSIPKHMLGFSAQDFVVGAVGRFVPVKNFDLLLKALTALVAELPNIKLLLIGQGPLENHLRTFVKKHTLEKYVQFVIGCDARVYYSSLDCFVQPSAYEGLSMALLEALCFGLPCIVTKKHDQHEVITHCKNGILIEPRNQKQLEEAIRSLYDDRKWAKNLGKEAYKTVEQQFNIHRMIQQYHLLFSQGI